MSGECNMPFINSIADAVMEMDADFQHPPRFVKPMVDGVS